MIVNEEIKISQGFRVKNHNSDASRMYFVFDGGCHVGTLTVTYYNSNYHSTFYFGENPIISDAFEKEIGINLTSKDDGLVVTTGKTSYDSPMSIVSSERDTYKTIELQTIDIATAEIGVQSIQNARTGNVYSVSAPYVANEQVGTKWICWAACVASISNGRYQTQYTAKDIFDAVSSAYPNSGTPIGDEPWYTRAYWVCGMTPSHSGNIGLSTLQTILSSNRAILCRMERTGAKHAVVLRNITVGSQDVAYGFMDPNVPGGHVYYYWGNTTCNPDQMVYDNGSQQYTWYASVY